jgi:hypothetical protein
LARKADWQGRGDRRGRGFLRVIRRCVFSKVADEVFAATVSLAASLRVQGNFGSTACGKTTRRANHRHRVQPSREKYSCFLLTQITGLFTAVPHPMRGAYRDRHGRWVWDAMAATASGAKAPDETLVADGEVVWS